MGIHEFYTTDRFFQVRYNCVVLEEIKGDNVDTIKAISGLWADALIVFLVLFVIMFRKQVSHLLLRFTGLHFKKGSTEVKVEAAETLSFNPTDANLTSTSTEAENKEVAATLESAVDDKDSFIGIIIREGFTNRNLQKVEEAYNHMLTQGLSKTEQQENRIYYLQIRYYLGDTEALSELLRFCEEARDHEFQWRIFRSIAQCYIQAGLKEKAIEFIDKSIGACPATAQRVDMIIEKSKLQFELGERSVAFRTVMNTLVDTDDPDELHTLYKGLSDLFENDKIPILKAVALSKALESKPNDTKTLFDVAYAFGDKDLELLAMFYYDRVLGFKPDHANALNNLGVAYRKLELPALSVDSYISASEKGNTLASANLASVYLGVGLTRDAETILKEALEKQDVHANVASALYRMNELRKDEAIKKEKLKTKASELHGFILKYADAMFKEHDKVSHIAGTWQTNDESEVSIEQSEDEVIATWKNQYRYYRLVGNCCNLGVQVTSVKYSYSMAFNEAKDAGQAFMYLDNERDNLVIMRVSGDESEILKLNRKAE